MSQDEMIVNDEKKKNPKCKFSPEEDNTLRQLVQAHGTGSWNLISRYFEDRTARQCRDRWNHYLSQESQNIEWSEEDDIRLLQLFDEYGSKWTSISKILPNRTAVSVRNRCCRLLRKKKQSEKKKNAKKGSFCTCTLLKPMSMISECKQQRVVFPSCLSLPFPSLLNNNSNCVLLSDIGKMNEQKC